MTPAGPVEPVDDEDAEEPLIDALMDSNDDTMTERKELEAVDTLQTDHSGGRFAWAAEYGSTKATSGTHVSYVARTGSVTDAEYAAGANGILLRRRKTMRFPHLTRTRFITRAVLRVPHPHPRWNVGL